MDANSDGKAKATSPVEHASANKLVTTGVDAIYDGDSAADVTAADGPIVIAPQSMDHIPVNPAYHLDDYDVDSAYGDDALNGDDLVSLASSITRYRYENGRRYHAYQDGAYWAPNDEIHNDQTDIAHHLWLLTLDNQLHLAPLQTPQSILDVGTGTGIWAIDMADKYPSANIIGVDLSPIQPTWVAPNCSFEIDDMTLPWTFAPGTFDYIHIREMFGSVPDWDGMFSEAYNALQPGGWIENVEHSVWPVSDDDSIGPDHIFTKYGSTMTELTAKMGKEADVWKKNKERMIKAGFVDVVEKRYKWPMRGWSSDPKMKELGRWNQLRVNQGIEGFAMRILTNVAGWSYTEVQAFVGQIRSALRDKKLHGYLDVSIMYGRKPSASNVS